VFSIDHFFQKDSAGKKLKVWYYDEDTRVWISHNKELGAVYPKFKELKSVDVVDEGAATDSLFSSSDEGIMLLTKAIYDPLFPAVLEANYKDWAPLNQFFKDKYSSGFLDQLLRKLGMQDGAASEQEERINLLNKKAHTMSEEINKLTAQNEELTAQRDQLQAERDQAQAQLTALQDTITTLAARIDALEAKPAASHTSGNEEEEGSDDTPLYHRSPVTQRAFSMKSKKQTK